MKKACPGLSNPATMITTLNTAKNLLRVSLCPCPGRPLTADVGEWDAYTKDGGLLFMADGANKARQIIKGAGIPLLAALTPTHTRAHALTPTHSHRRTRAHTHNTHTPVPPL